MLNSIRNFSKTIWAKILLVILIIPFIFWGMGDVFRKGASNTVAKINKLNISTQNFIDHANSLKLSSEVIRENIDNSIIENILSDLINQNLLSLEAKKLNLEISDSSLSEIIKNDQNFAGTDKQFSRTKYEKFLITNNVSAANYEKNLRIQESNKLLFAYIGGGTTPPLFLVNETFNYQNKKLNIQAIKLNSLYKNKLDYNKKDIDDYIKKNANQLKEDFISFRFSAINPISLLNLDEFNDLFFEKIDEMENQIINGSTYDEIIKNYNLKTESVKSINKNGESEETVPQKKMDKELAIKIFGSAMKEVGVVNLFEHKNEYILVIVDEIKSAIANVGSIIFEDKIIKSLIEKDAFEYNQRLIAKLKTNSFSKYDFEQLAKENELKTITLSINGIRDDNFFDIDTNKKIFMLAKDTFTLVNNINKNETFLIWLNEIQETKLSNTSENYEKYRYETSIDLKNNIYSTFDYYLSDKYKVQINHQTLERLKNYYR